MRWLWVSPLRTIDRVRPHDTKASLAAGGLGVLAAALMALETWLEYSQARAQFQSAQLQSDPFTALLLIGLGGPIVCLLASVAGWSGVVHRLGAAGALLAVGFWVLWSIAWRMALPVDAGWSLLSVAGGVLAIVAGALFVLRLPPGGTETERPSAESKSQPPADGSPAIIDLDSDAMPLGRG